LRSGSPTGGVLAAEGVTWALVYLDAPGVQRVSLAGLQLAFRGRYLALYRVVGTVHAGPDVRPSGPVAHRVAAIDIGVLVFVLVAAGAPPVLRRRRAPVADPD